MTNAITERLRAYTDARGGESGMYPTGLPWAFVLRSSFKTSANHILYKPSLCIVAQGRKEMLFGQERLAYTAMQALVVRVDLPASGRIVDASADEPFLGMSIAFDVAVMRDLLRDLDGPPPTTTPHEVGAFVIHVDGALADAILRVVRLLDDPLALRVLGPALHREILFRMLTGAHRDAVRTVAVVDGHFQGVATAIRMMHDDIARPLLVPDLAKAACMSATAFHKHFKSLTSLSPLQFQKRLRLLEARRLLLDNSANAETAAFSVGYQSASQFSREYSRMFGSSPKRDAQAP